ncbi:MAG: ATP-binding protein [Chitinophagales bacterium]|nr:ATP-binding protein [Chitinophagales bacterium]
MSFRICITGTESTGKTTLAEQLAVQTGAVLVPDVSREYIAALNRSYTQADVLAIAEEIIARESRLYVPGKLLISDNDLINIKIWLMHCNMQVPDWLNEQIRLRDFELFLLCYIDVPWQADEQRANPHDREVLYNHFVNELKAVNAPYKVLKGSKEERLEEAKAAIRKIL